MKVNQALFDRLLRVVLGVGLLSIVWWGPQTAFGYIGIIPLVTGMLGFCPLYKIFGFSTCPIKR